MAFQEAKVGNLTLTYDPVAHAYCLYVVPKDERKPGRSRQKQIGKNPFEALAEYDEEGNLIGIEILNVF